MTFFIDFVGTAKQKQKFTSLEQKQTSMKLLKSNNDSICLTVQGVPEKMTSSQVTQNSTKHFK